MCHSPAQSASMAPITPCYKTNPLTWSMAFSAWIFGLDFKPLWVTWDIFPAFHMSAYLSVPPDTLPPHSASNTSSSFRCQLKRPLSREAPHMPRDHMRSHHLHSQHPVPSSPSSSSRFSRAGGSSVASPDNNGTVLPCVHHTTSTCHKTGTQRTHSR